MTGSKITVTSGIATVGEFAKLVKNMRLAQKEYFYNRGHGKQLERLRYVKDLERRVDAALAARDKREWDKANPTLF